MGADESPAGEAVRSDLTVVLEGVDPTTTGRRPRRWRRRALIAASVVVGLVAAVAGAGTYYVMSVHVGELLSLPATTVLYYSDGSVLARLGQVERTPLAWDEFVDEVPRAAVAAQDPQFWTDRGGPIARGVVRHGFDLVGESTSARARLGVLAWRIDGTLSKEELLTYYLNAVPFGRNAFGVEAAARAFFGKTANKTAPLEDRLTLAEAMLLLAQVDQPEPDPVDPLGSP